MRWARFRAVRLLATAATVVAIGLAAPTCLGAQPAELPRPEDVTTLDGILRAYYEVVSGPAGEPRQTARDHSLHHPDARAIVTGVDRDSEPYIRNLKLEEYHQLSERAGNPAFYEWEIHRVTQRFGNVAHVWSTYAFSDTEGGPVRGRGINSIQLYHDGARWWITAWIFDSERADNPIPAAFLPRDN